MGQGALNRGLQLEKAGAASSVNYVGVVFAFLWQIVLLGQTPSVYSFAGAGLICTYAAFDCLSRDLRTPSYAVILFVKKMWLANRARKQLKELTAAPETDKT